MSGPVVARASPGAQARPRHTRHGQPRGATSGLALSLAAVALLTLTPTGRGWVGANPADELRWYLSELHSAVTLGQWAGNLLLFAAPAAFAAVRWPALTRPARLLAASVASAATVETLQRVLPLGRVVSPLDALLNVIGAVVAGLVVAHVSSRPGAKTAELAVTLRLIASRSAASRPPCQRPTSR